MYRKARHTYGGGMTVLTRAELRDKIKTKLE